VIRSADVALARFPFADLSSAKLRPVVVLARVPGPHEDYLVVFVSSQVDREIKGVDIVLRPADAAFADAGLKVASLIRIGKVAVLARKLFAGTVGRLPESVFAAVVDRHVALLRGLL
jgi:mRNA interferase MazF